MFNLNAYHVSFDIPYIYILILIFIYILDISNINRKTYIYLDYSIFNILCSTPIYIITNRYILNYVILN